MRPPVCAARSCVRCTHAYNSSSSSSSSFDTRCVRSPLSLVLLNSLFSLSQCIGYSHSLEMRGERQELSSLFDGREEKESKCPWHFAKQMTRSEVRLSQLGFASKCTRLRRRARITRRRSQSDHHVTGNSESHMSPTHRSIFQRGAFFARRSLSIFGESLLHVFRDMSIDQRTNWAIAPCSKKSVGLHCGPPINQRDHHGRLRHRRLD